VFDSAKLMYATGGGDFYDTEISQSLRFDYSSGAYLNRIQGSGNRTTFTYSFWMKLGSRTSDSHLFTFNNPANVMYMNTDGRLYWYDANGSSFYLVTSQLFRDFSSWYHIVAVADTNNATQADRIRLYVNGTRVTDFSTANYPSSGYTTGANQNGTTATIGRSTYSFGGYLTEVNFIDGQALDPTSFGEFKSGVWIPKAYSGSYGTNGFYLPFNHDYSVEGFSATTYSGQDGDLYVGGVGFEPDLVWIKNRNNTGYNVLTDSVRGVTKTLGSDSTSAESTQAEGLQSFNSDGFTLGDDNGDFNRVGRTYVAWCWDAGTGSPVSNTDGSITSTVKASTDYGFSIVSFNAGAAGNHTVGHGLSSAPELIIMKDRQSTGYGNWLVFHSDVCTTTSNYLLLNGAGALGSVSNSWGSALPTSSVFGFGSNVNVAANDNIIAYCFHSVSGYSKIGSYTGTGASGNKITTGFKPAFVMIKDSTNSGNSWVILDSTRDTTDPRESGLYPDGSYEEIDVSPYGYISSFDSDGFTVAGSGGAINLSGATMIYMAFADKREAAFWLDQSGNNNDFDNNNLTESDISLDSPTNNFATLNPLHSTYTQSMGSYFSEGGLRYLQGATANYGIAKPTIAFPSTGKYYIETLIGSSGGLTHQLGIIRNPARSSAASSYLCNSCTDYCYSYQSNGYVAKGSSSPSYISTSAPSFTNNDIMALAFDADNETVKWYKNGTLAYTLDLSTSPDGYGADDGGWTFAMSMYVGLAPFYANFGQDSSFAGNKTAQGNTDDNGYGDFYYAPPSGYLALCTANLPDPVESIDPAQDGSPQDHFNTVLFSGTGSTQSITGVGFQPDWIWFKARSVANDHAVFDSVRGATKGLSTNLTSSETTASAGNDLASFDSDGFTVGSPQHWSSVNGSSRTIVAWNWKANGSGVSNTDGSITSTVSANTDAGFSIVSFTPAGVDGSFGHGLNSAPEFVVWKNRNGTNNWTVLTTAVDGSFDYGFLNLTAAFGNTSGTLSTSSVVNFEAYLGSSDYIAYCFHSVDGFSKFGSYTGNGSSDGPFVYTGFRPAFVMFKRIDSGTNAHWIMMDSTRKTYNPIYPEQLFANISESESGLEGGNTRTDFLSNGFKLRDTYSGVNGSSASYIYMAFAENPFKYANAR
jgi:hypothetical protein